MRLTILFSFFIGFLFSQKAELTGGIIAFNKKDITSAKELIDVAHKKYMEKIKSGSKEKPKIMSKLWHYRGQVYLELGDLDIAAESFLTDIKLNAKGGLQKKSVAALNVCTSKCVTQADESYKKAKELFDSDRQKSKDYLLNSANLFLKTYEIRKNLPVIVIDTTSLFNACLLYSELDTPEADLLALEQARKLVELDSKKENHHLRLLFCLEKKGDNNELLSAIKSARSNIPSSTKIINTEVNFYISIEDKEGLKSSLDAAIKSDSSNPTLHFALGTALQSLGDIEMAKQSYLQALELDSDYFDAHNNLASMYLEETTSVIKKMNRLGSSSSDQRKYDSLKKKRNVLYNQSIPHLEVCVKLQPESVTILNVLKEIYYKVGDVKNTRRIKGMLDSL